MSGWIKLKNEDYGYFCVDNNNDLDKHETVNIEHVITFDTRQTRCDV